MILKKVFVDKIIEDLMIKKIMLTYENLNFSNQEPIRNFLQKNVNKILQENTKSTILNFPLSIFSEVENFCPKLKNISSTRWILKWNLWDIFSSITNKLLYSVYTDQWKVMRNKILLISLQDCSKYFANYFYFLKINEQVKVKQRLLQIYRIFIKITQKFFPDEKLMTSLRYKYKLIYEKWLSDKEILVRLKKKLKISGKQNNFKIPMLPNNKLLQTEQNIEKEYEISLNNIKNPYFKVFYGIETEDGSRREVDLVVRIGAIMKDLLGEIKCATFRNPHKEILETAALNSFITKIVSDRYKLLYESFHEQCINFTANWQTAEKIQDQFSRLATCLKLTEDFIIDCLLRYCHELDIYQKLFTLYIADIASHALSLYK